MRDALFHLRRVDNVSLQSQIRETLVTAILGGQIPCQEPIPSTRQMARRLGVSRNTVVLAYQALVDDGFLLSRERSGFYVNEALLHGKASPPKTPARPHAEAVDWSRRFRVRPSAQDNIEKPADWQAYRYPFIYGQVDRTLFPIAEWRDCTRQALGTKSLADWTSDSYTIDDPTLIEQIRTRILPRRGIMAGEEQVLITLGAQNALYIVTSLLVTGRSRVAIEEPGYPDLRNVLRLRSDRVLPIPIDRDGLPVDGRLRDCDLAFTTPSHQFPTTVTMPLERRLALLEEAGRGDLLIVEDDYEFEANYVSEPCPALKSLDQDDRVIYVGSFSKSLFPGLRLGFMVGPPQFIREARALRRLMLRHPPSINQRTAALFLALGHFDSLVHRLHKAYAARWQAMGEALAKHLPRSSRMPTFGGTSYWVQGPKGLDADRLAESALDEGLVIEPGRINYSAPDAPGNTLRLGFSSIPLERIEPGIALLAELIDWQLRNRKGRNASAKS